MCQKFNIQLYHWNEDYLEDQTTTIIKLKCIHHQGRDEKLKIWKTFLVPTQQKQTNKQMQCFKAISSVKEDNPAKGKCFNFSVRLNQSRCMLIFLQSQIYEI